MYTRYLAKFNIAFCNKSLNKQWLILPAFVFFIVLVLTLYIYTLIKADIDEQEKEHFNNQFELISNALSENLDKYNKAIQSVVSLFNSSNNISSEEWQAYINSLNIRDNYVAMESIGFSKYKPTTNANNILSNASFSNPIIYINHLNGNYDFKLGDDLLQIPEIEATIKNILYTKSPSVTFPIHFKSAGSLKQIMMLSPIYNINSNEKNINNFSGFVFNEINLNRLFDSITKPYIKNMRIQIEDRTLQNNPTLIYSNFISEKNTSPLSKTLHKSLSFQFNNHIFQLQVQAYDHLLLKPFINTENLSLLIGLLLSILLSGLVYFIIVNYFQSLEIFKKQKQYEKLVEETPGAILIHVDGIIKFINKAGLEVLGATSPTQILDKSILDFIPKENQALFFANGKKELTSNSSNWFEHQIIKLNGSKLEVESTSAPFIFNDMQARQIVMRDLTQHNHVTAQLQLYSKAINASTNAFLIIQNENDRKVIKHVNPAFQKITGYNASEVLEKSWDFLYTNTKNLKKIVHAINNNLEAKSYLEGKKKNGELFWHELSIIPVYNNDQTVTHYIGVLNDLTQINKYQLELEQKNNYDNLTSLPNRNLLQQQLVQSLEFAKQNHHSIAVVNINLDNFKLLNESYGHLIGDEILKLIALRIKDYLEADDFLARLNTDEFVIILNNQENVRNIAIYIQNLLTNLATSYSIDHNEIDLTASIGYTLYPSDGDNEETLLRNAYIATQRAKDLGGNNQQGFLKSMNDKLNERLELEKNLKKAIKNEEFVLFYQPKIDIKTGLVIGCEALIRWQHPVKGWINPAEFIPTAEHAGLIVQIGEWVLRKACFQNKIWLDKGLPKLTISVNISARQFEQKNFMTIVKKILKE
ncbi:MAG: sensor diguanylate cyclase/phosphodiesterase, partial [Francisellaceae bacterium]|nr:sensor diguanylate cyclase/phosphodiesterase [Francisellaceae bacterium]